MAAAAERTLTRPTETIVDFSADRVKAPFLVRCAALFVDYALMVIVPIGWLIVSGWLSETGTAGTIGGAVWLLWLTVFVINYLALPMLRGQTLGKMFFGLTILRTDGTRLTLGRAALRHLPGYLLTVLTCGIGFLIAAFTSSGRSLHDVVSGTVVVRGRKMPV
jgi:uncharacterized RDD family membrane protein YckC